MAQLSWEYEVPLWPHVLYCRWRTSAVSVCTLTSLDVGRAVRRSEQVQSTEFDLYQEAKEEYLGPAG